MVGFILFSLFYLLLKQSVTPPTLADSFLSYTLEWQSEWQPNMKHMIVQSEFHIGPHPA